MENNLKVMIWGREVGRLTWNIRRNRSVFEYNPDFLKRGLDIAPLTASIKNAKNRFPFYGLQNDNVFHGLPGFISDSMPGRWGNTVFSAWAQSNNIREKDLTPIDKLSFIGQRGMGALEFEPSKQIGQSDNFSLDDLYRKAQEILQKREDTVITGKDISLESLYEVGTSAGGQHTKAIIARNNITGEIRSGQVLLPSEYTYYILKFAEKDYYPLTKVEMVYYEMAKSAGIEMMPSELIKIDGDYHFITERYDRKNGKKIHTQTLAAMNPEANSYEDLMTVCDELHLPYKEKEETYRRMVFNILTTNVDAHIQNFSFMMKENESWHITPAYDLTFSCFNPGNHFDPSHYLKVNGKSMNINREDLLIFGRRNDIRNPEEIIRKTVNAVLEFRNVSGKYSVDNYWIDKIEEHFAEMNPELLSSLNGYKPYVFNYILKDRNISITNAQWIEMGNGAIRLTAELNGIPFKRTFAKTSTEAKNMMDLGGIKMSMEQQREYVNKYFVPKYLELYSDKEQH